MVLLKLADLLEKIDFDAYQQITFRTEDSLFKGMRFPVRLFHLGRYFKSPVKIAIVEGGQSRDVLYSPEYEANPEPVWRRLRHDHPCFYDTVRGMYVFTRHADVTALFADHETYSAAPYEQLTGAVVGLVLMATGKAGRKTAVPFGPFLVLGSLLAIVWGQDYIDLILAR